LIFNKEWNRQNKVKEETVSNKCPKILILLVLFGLSAAFSTDVLANRLGLKMGLQTKYSFKFGLFYTFDLGQNLQLQPEVYYTQRNYGINIPNVFFPVQIPRTKDTIKYIEVPLLLRYKPNLMGPITPVLFGGGYALFKVGEKLISNEFLNDLLPRNYTDVSFGVVVGAGFELVRGKITLHADFHANIGFDWLRKLDYSKLVTERPSFFYNNKSSSFSILGGISF
jgi:hypothetical protein